MKSLIMKDFLYLKSQSKVYLVIIIFYMGLSFVNRDATFLMGMLMVLAAMQSMTTMAYDEKYNWQKYELTMPISRRTVVFEKYLFSLIFVGLTFLVSVLCGLFIGVYFNQPLMESIVSNFAMLAFAAFMTGATLPFLFKFGMEKARLIMILIMIVPAAAIFLLAKSGINPPGDATIRLLLILLPICLVILIAVSIISSLRIYQKKEF